MNIKALEQLLNSESRRGNVSDLKVLIETPSGESFTFQQDDSRPTHFIASSTKMMAAAMIFKLVQQGKLSLHGKVLEVLDQETVSVLLGLADKSWLESITVDNLLRHTSGFQDYRVPGELMKTPNVEQAMRQHPGWTFEEIATSTLSKGRAKRQGSKAVYSGLNYQLIGKIVENLHGKSQALAFDDLLTKPLAMDSTYLFDQSSLGEFEHHSQLLVGDRLYLGARRMASLGYEGAVVSSLRDTMKFLKAYFHGQIFNQEVLKSAQDKSLPLFPGVKMGAGVMSLKVPAFKGITPKVPTLIGHAGMTGHQMFYIPKHGLFIVMTPNQIGDPTLGAKILSKVLARVI